jgi:hypothetical protein
MSIKATLTFLKENAGVNNAEEELQRKDEILAFEINYTINMFSEDL